MSHWLEPLSSGVLPVRESGGWGEVSRWMGGRVGGREGSRSAGAQKKERAWSLEAEV